MESINLTIYTKYSSSYQSAVIDFTKHFLFFVSSIFGVYYFRESMASIATVPLLSLMLLRTFIIFHDCGHNSYTPNRSLNYLIGSICGPFVMTPFSWNSKHFMHHLTNGNIENVHNYRWSETVQYTVNQYNQLNSGYQLLYRIFRDPFVFFTVIPFFHFFILSRVSILYSNGYNYTTRETTTDWIINNVGMVLQQYVYYLSLIHI